MGVLIPISHARRYLGNDNHLDDWTLLSVGGIVSLLELCLNATYLQFKGNFYQQTQGRAMGSPVSVTVVNLVMENVEQRALNSFVGAKPLFLKRYVDIHVQPYMRMR